MDHRALRNLIAFLLGFLLMTVVALASAAAPETWYRVAAPNGGLSVLMGAMENCIGIESSTRAGLDAAYFACAPAELVTSVTYSKSGTVTNCDLPQDTCRIYYDRTTSTTTYPNDAYVKSAIERVSRCWDGLEPVGGVCPEPPMCQSGLTVDWFFTSRAALPPSVCDKQSCRWDQAGGVSLCLPEDLTCLGAYTSTGDYCQGGTITLDAQALDKPWQEYIDRPVTETTVDHPAPVTNGDTVTDQRVTTTETDRAVKIERTANETTVTETGVHGISKTTTTTTTTHADGSQTITETVSYERTDPAITTTRIGAGGSVTTQPGETVTGSRTTTSVVGADGSVTSTTTESGVGGDGEGGPESDDGECGILPQVVCDFLSGDGEGEEHPGLPAEEVGGEMVAYDSGLGGGSCPGSVGASFMGQLISYDYSDACYVATTYFRPILLAIAAIVAAFIIVGARL